MAVDDICRGNSGSYTIGRFALLLTDPHFLVVLILTDHHLQVVLVLTYPHFLEWYDPSVLTEVLVVFPVLAEVLVVVLIRAGVLDTDCALDLNL